MIEPYEELLLSLLREAMRRGTLSDQTRAQLTEETAGKVLQLAAVHHLLPLTGALILEALPQALAVRQQVIGSMARQVQADGALLGLREALDREGVPFLVIKGAACRSMYPNPDLRPSSDEDLLVMDADLHRAETILEGLGYARCREEAEDSVHTWYNQNLHVELHRRLLPENKLRGLDLQKRFSRCFEHKMAFHLEGKTLWTLGPEDHLLYLILHYYKHFLSGGVGIRQLCDIVLFVDRYGMEIDRERLWQDLRQLRLDVFFQNLLDIGVRHLGMEAELLPAPGELGEADSAALLRDILDAGVFGGSTMERRHSGNITIQAAKSGKKKSVLSAVFPSADSLKGRYPYLRRHPWLLPAAWFSRGVTYLRHDPNAVANGVDSARIGKQRVALLEKYGII